MRNVATLTGLGAGASLAVGYVLAGLLAHAFHVGDPHARLVPSLWPPSGLAIAALLLGGYRCWPWLALGAFALQLIVTSGAIWLSLGIAAGATCEALAAAWLTQRFAGGRAAFRQARWFFVFALYGAIGSAMVGATIGANCLLAAGRMEFGAFRAVWTTWWLGGAIGAMLVTPLVMLLAEQRPKWLPRRALEFALLLVLLTAVSWLVFGLPNHERQPRTYLVMPCLIWAGLRFRPLAAATAVLVLAVNAVAWTAHGCGPFAWGTSDATTPLLLQVFLGFMSAMTLTIALVSNESAETARALHEAREELELRVAERTAKLKEANEVLANEIGERTEAQRELADSERRFRELVEAAPDAIVIVSDKGRIEIANAQTERFFGYERRELVGMQFEGLLSERFRAWHVAERAAFLANPRLRTMGGEALELFGRRKDGTEFPIDVSLSPLISRGSPAMSATIRDMTRRKRWEQERLANESLRSQVAELSRRTEEIGTLNRMADMLRAAMSPAEAYPLVAPFLEELFPGYCGAVYVFDESGASLHAVARWGKESAGEPSLLPDSCWALRRGQLHVVGETETAGVCEHLPHPRPSVSLCIPLVAKAQTLGVFHLVRPAVAAAEGARPSPDYSDYKQGLAQAAAEQIASAIANARLHQELRIQAIHDPLTGLFNRRSFEESLSHELHRAHRRQSRLGVLMLDIDHFKKLNDRFGHGAGDLTLREIARLLQHITRKEDIVCRYGGEEITVVLVDCSLPDLRRRAEQIRQGIRELRLEYHGKPLGRITVSIGAAIRPDHGTSADELLRAADEALYRAKSAGRDRIEVAGVQSEDGGGERPGARSLRSDRTAE